MLFSNRIDAETCNQQDTCLADTYSLPATCPEETSDLPTETSDLPYRTLPPAQQNSATCPTETCHLPNRTLQPANRTINLNHNL